MRVPLLIRYPGKLKPQHNDVLLSTPDIYPTLLGLMGFENLIPKEVDGQNFAGYLRTGKGKTPESQWYMRVENGKTEYGTRGVRTSRYTYVINQNASGRKVMLFDRQTDPYQLDNLAGKKPKQEKKLSREMESWLRKNNDPWLKHIQ